MREVIAVFIDEEVRPKGGGDHRSWDAWLGSGADDGGCSFVCFTGIFSAYGSLYADLARDVVEFIVVLFTDPLPCFWVSLDFERDDLFFDDYGEVLGVEFFLGSTVSFLGIGIAIPGSEISVS